MFKTFATYLSPNGNGALHVARFNTTTSYRVVLTSMGASPDEGAGMHGGLRKAAAIVRSFRAAGWTVAK